ncbi:MAG TPA: L-ribulose-5-phosphate 3-epimerase [Lachnoclostridium sp.]|uniref:L-ribulose-5-phosphate 3-epimerase n=1 Tax=[Clostridium] celerecrescens 18A TaxID=1286362 RepID=A0A2M8Z2I5_9FIRM|nr:L-ribulose-5-phosphate 3-epimerase [Lacrimispora celerecrescens]PJJ27655.1 L-ribulose-5-phosphate 3-epimerase [[Clostridium] celerecrescens 18A]HBE86614.1 L-ribulose-5-phosphate 3-epimerase [Lachnoclostridium sp.]
MKTYTLGLYEKSMPAELSWKEKLEAAKSAGFDFLEMSIDETEEKLERLEMTEKERLELIKLTKDAGIPIGTMCLSGHRKYPLGSHDPEVKKKSMEIMSKAIELASDLGIRIIQLAGYDVYYEESDEETRRYFTDNLKKAAEMAASAGVVLAFETMETGFMNTVEKAMKYVKQVSSVYLNVYPDIGNITNAAFINGTDVLEDLKLGSGRLAAMHLKETKPGIFREVPYGEGHVDFKKAIETAWKLGVRIYVAEFWYTGNPSWKEDLVAANLKMTGILREQE